MSAKPSVSPTGESFAHSKKPRTRLADVEGKFARWLAVGITDSITELIFVLMAAFLVSDLRMSMVRKGTVVFAFGLRLL